jgi:hypothetical protein
MLRAPTPLVLVLAMFPRMAATQADPLTRATSRFAAIEGAKIHYKSLGVSDRTPPSGEATRSVSRSWR